MSRHLRNCRTSAASRNAPASSWPQSTAPCLTKSGPTAAACSRGASRSPRSASCGLHGRRGSGAERLERERCNRTEDTKMDLRLKGKTALVTGASMGIGRAIARGLAAEGVSLCIAARRKNMLEELAAEIPAADGTQPLIVAIDIMAEDAPQRLAAAALEGLGRIDILVNCAGGSRPPIPIDAPEAEWEHAMTLNFVRVRQLTHAVLPGMIQHKWGRIINISGKSEPARLIAATP